MNIANEIDMAVDEAIKRHLGRLLDAYFQSPGEGVDRLRSGVQQLTSDARAVIKALDNL